MQAYHARGTRAATPAEMAEVTTAIELTEAQWRELYEGREEVWPDRFDEWIDRQEGRPEPDRDAWDTRYPLPWPEPEPLGPTEQDEAEMHARGNWTADYDAHA